MQEIIVRFFRWIFFFQEGIIEIIEKRIGLNVVGFYPNLFILFDIGKYE